MSEASAMSPRPASTSNLLLRVASALPLAALTIYLLLVSEYPLGFVALVCVGGVLASFEMSRVVALAAAPYRVWVSLMSFVMAYAVGSQGFSRIELADLPQLPLLPTFVCLIFGAFAMALFEPEPTDRAGWQMAWLFAAPAYLGTLLGVLMLLFLRPSGGEWVLLAMFYAFFSDTLAYFSGRFVGRYFPRKLFPAVSPKKTWAGAYGGLVGAVSGSLLASFTFLPELPLVAGVVLALVAGLVGQLGDLIVSLMKRSTGVKDTGGILPGHGGVLDRVDAFLFTSAVTWIYVEYIL